MLEILPSQSLESELLLRQEKQFPKSDTQCFFKLGKYHSVF